MNETQAPRIALIHGLAHSMPPINAGLEAQWPQALRMNLLDDALSADLARSGGLDAAMFDRFQRLTDYAVDTGADAVLFTCSAFGPCIEAAARRHADRPVLKPNEAMVDEAAAMGATVGLVASFPPSLVSLPAEFPAHITLHTALAEGALAALDAGRVEEHDAAVVRTALQLQARGCSVLALPQFSLARAAPAVRQATGLPVLTTVDTAIARLRARLGR